MDLFSDSDIPSVNLSNKSDHKDNNQEQPATSGGDSSCLEPQTTPFDTASSIKQDETSVQVPTLDEIDVNEHTDTWNNEQPQKSELNALLRTMFELNVNANVAIYIGDKIFMCHMTVLQCYSKFFKKCTSEFKVRLPQDKVTPKAFRLLYKWMLSEKYHIIPEAICEIFSAAKYLDIEELVRQCWLYFSNTDCFREGTAFLMYMQASKAGHKDLEQLMLMRVSKFFLTVVSSRDFLELSENQLCNILSSNAIGVNSEMEVLFSTVRWLTYNWKQRKQFRVKVVKCVRFKLMHPWYLVSLTKDAVAPEVLKVVKHPEVKQMISDGLEYVTSQMFHSKSDIEFHQFVKKMELTPSPQRTWIYDEKCEYHHSSLPEKVATATYEVFKAYLGRIRILGVAHWHQLELVKDVNGSVTKSST